METPQSFDFFRHQHTVRRIAVGRNQDGRLEVFALHWDIGISRGHVWHIWQEPNNGWSDWQDAERTFEATSYPGYPTTLDVGQNQDGRLELFKMTDGQQGPWHIWQTSPNNGWSEWRNAGGDARFSWESLAVGRNVDGRLGVFTIGFAPNGVRHAWQTSPNAG